MLLYLLGLLYNLLSNSINFIHNIDHISRFIIIPKVSELKDEVLENKSKFK
jgi:hypothetical protein